MSDENMDTKNMVDGPKQNVGSYLRRLSLTSFGRCGSFYDDKKGDVYVQVPTKRGRSAGKPRCLSRDI